MIGHIRRAEAETGSKAKVLMDLAGPKPRTGEVATPENATRLFEGDIILLARDRVASQEGFPFQTTCTLPQALTHLEAGQEVWIDDGKLGTVVEGLVPEGYLLRVTQARPKGEKLQAGKGLNFPDTLVELSPLTERDLHDLDFVAAHTDLVGYSFVQRADDIELLQRELYARVGERAFRLGIVAKVETKRAVRNLPELMVHAAAKQPFGVMIARGDLAVEIGYERLAEIQEEMLWLCEAARVPVIWATQVLENLVRKGTPTRAEMTDAAMSERAECVMLNKGPFILEGVRVLVDVLVRMQDHQTKKTPQLRALRIWSE
jgi:pyruvate kinase